MGRLTEQQKEYIRSHMDEEPKYVAKLVGCTVGNVLYHWNKLDRGNRKDERNRKHMQMMKMVVDLYPAYPASHIASKLGVTRSCINRMAKSLGITHSPECLKKMEVEQKKRLLSKEVVEKRTKTWKKRLLVDRIRMLSGLPQKTNLKTAAIPNKTLCVRSFLVRQYGYIYDVSLKQYYTLFYDGTTSRLTQERENAYTSKYHLVFKSIVGDIK